MATSGMPFSAALATSLAVDKIHEGETNIIKNASSGIVGEIIDHKYPLSPFIREGITQYYEKKYYSPTKEKLNDKK